MLRARFTRSDVRMPSVAQAMAVASSRVRRQLLAGAVALATVSLLAAAPALADTQTRNLTLHTVGAPQSVDVVCLNDACTMLQATVTGTATSNLAGQGTFQLRLIRTFLDNGCHSGEEFTTFTFGTGTISTHTPTFTTCGTPTGLIFEQPFEITGGTGMFAGATGGGREFTAPGGPAPIMWIGTVTA
jgi:hypothetical protein